MLACFHLGKMLYSDSMLSLYMRMMHVYGLETKAHKETKMLFWVLFAGSKGAITRIKIVSLLKNRPYNTNQLSTELNLDYKTIQHHMKTLEKNNLVSKLGMSYASAYFPSQFLEVNMSLFDEIGTKLGQSN